MMQDRQWRQAFPIAVWKISDEKHRLQFSEPALQKFSLQFKSTPQPALIWVVEKYFHAISRDTWIAAFYQNRSALSLGLSAVKNVQQVTWQASWKGCWKYPMVQVGAKLTVLNLSQQTDSADLLGGFRPVQAAEAFLPLVTRFNYLFSSTFTKGSNDAFLGRASKFAQRAKWASLLQAFKAALAKVQPHLLDTWGRE